MSGYQTLIFEKHGEVARISLNRPGALNSYNIQMRDDFSEALTAVQYDDEVKALIISGQGRAFCAGADLTEFGTAPSQVEARQVRWQRDVWGQLNKLRIPSIAAIHGYCIGSGIEIALFCDLRIVSDDAVFAMPEVRLGMIPAAGGSQTLPRNFGTSAAMDLLLTGRRFGANEAQALGLVTRVVATDELQSAAWDLAEVFCRLPGEATGPIKKCIREGMDLSLADGLALENRLAQIAYRAHGTDISNILSQPASRERVD
ncbi:MAG: enoyl-CoA hydratase/isomerase family protein [Chloroflexi bacterium]|nr:enoyl-CoA hydratase/isomerase family protein [Chloroflexota bacterium]